MDFTTPTKYLAMFFLLMPAFQSCEYTVVEPDLHDNYFPLHDAAEWRYQRWFDNRWVLDTLSLRVDGTIEIDGRMYSRIVKPSGEVDKFVRVEGSQYFGRYHELYGASSYEYMFLDTDKAVGESWSYVKDAGRSKTEYQILAKNAERNINGKVYKNVIEVQVNYYNLETDVLAHWVTALHYYAEGIGEVYYHYPYGVSGTYGAIDGFIIDPE